MYYIHMHSYIHHYCSYETPQIMTKESNPKFKRVLSAVPLSPHLHPSKCVCVYLYIYMYVYYIYIYIYIRKHT